MMANPRQHYRCLDCPWRIAWDFDGERDPNPPNPSWRGDPDMGLIVAAHIQSAHPASEYLGSGLVVPSWRDKLALQLGGQR